MRLAVVDRRGRKWRRPKRCANRLKRQGRIPPSTRSQWEAKARIIAHLKSIMPLSDAVVEDVQAVTRAGRDASGMRPSALSKSAKNTFIASWGPGPERADTRRLAKQGTA